MTAEERLRLTELWVMNSGGSGYKQLNTLQRDELLYLARKAADIGLMENLAFSHLYQTVLDIKKGWQ